MIGAPLSSGCSSEGLYCISPQRVKTSRADASVADLQEFQQSQLLRAIESTIPQGAHRIDLLAGGIREPFQPPLHFLLAAGAIHERL